MVIRKSGNFLDDPIFFRFFFFSITFRFIKIYNTQKFYPVLFAMRRLFKSQKMIDANYKSYTFSHFCKFCETRKETKEYVLL